MSAVTAPDAMTAVTARISAIRAQIGSVSSRASTATSTTAFAEELDGALRATPGTDRPAGGRATGQATGTQAAGTPATGAPATGTPATGAAVPLTGTTSAHAGTARTAVTGDTVVATAEKYLGVPYVWGGTTSAGLDCSGLVQRTFADLGIDLPRVSRDQATVGEAVPSMAEAKPGDLIAFGDPVDHIAIYVGDGKILEAPEPGKDVRIVDMFRTPTAIRRVVTAGDGTAATGTTVTTALGIPPGFLTLWDASALAEVPRAVPVSSLDLSGSALVTDGSSSSGGLSAQQLTAAGLTDAVASFAADFASAEARYQLPSGLLAAVAQAESGGRADAVSPAGAEGLMQLMPGTAAALGVSDAFDPRQAIDGAARYLSEQLASFGGELDKALAAYNAGPGAVRRYDGVPPYAETQQYVQKITDMMARLT